MNFEVKDGILTIFASGRIDSNNAEEIGREFDAIMSENPHEATVIDAEKLEYISSAGLRVVLKLRKQEANLKVANVTTEVYDIFEMTGFTEMMDIEKAYRRMDVEGCDIIGKGANGTVYRYNPETIVKVYRDAGCLPDIKRERELARRAFVLGIPTAISYDIVKVGDSFGSVFELLNAKSFSELITNDAENRDNLINEYAELLRKIHSTGVRPEDMPNAKPRVQRWIETCKMHLDAEDIEKVQALLDALPDVMNMVHCDYHTNNVMLQNGEVMMIDMDTISHGHPVLDLMNVYATFVGFNEFNKQNTIDFLGMPDEIAGYVWEKFLPAYLETEDEERIKDVESKAMLLSYLRVIHNLDKMGADKNAANIAVCKTKVKDLLAKLDKLDF